MIAEFWAREAALGFTPKSGSRAPSAAGEVVPESPTVIASPVGYDWQLWGA